MHGAWRKVVIKFQDSPTFLEYGKGNENTTMFHNAFTGVMGALPPDTYMAAGSTRGSPIGRICSSHLPVSSIILKDGNKHAKPWTKTSHRPNAQIKGYNWGFTLCAHCNMIVCDEVWPTMLELLIMGRSTLDRYPYLEFS